MTNNHWFAMRVTYRREMRLKAELDEMGVPAFVPMRRIVKKGSLLKNDLAPAIHNLIFIHANEEMIKAMKASRPELQYMMRRMDGRMEKIVVPEQQMNDFMRVCSTSPDFVEIIPSNCTNITEGEEVMVVSGPLKGVRGLFRRVEGHRSRRLIVSIKGACSATIAVDAKDITKI